MTFEEALRELRERAYTFSMYGRLALAIIEQVEANRKAIEELRSHYHTVNGTMIAGHMLTSLPRSTSLPDEKSQ